MLRITSMWPDGDILDIGYKENVVCHSADIVKEFLLAHSHDLDIFRANFDSDRDLSLELWNAIDREEHSTGFSFQSSYKRYDLVYIDKERTNDDTYLLTWVSGSQKHECVLEAQQGLLQMICVCWSCVSKDEATFWCICARMSWDCICGWLPHCRTSQMAKAATTGWSIDWGFHLMVQIGSYPKQLHMPCLPPVPSPKHMAWLAFCYCMVTHDKHTWRT